MNLQQTIPELVNPVWQEESKLIGYGLFSLVFRPAFLMPNPEIFDFPKVIEEAPLGFVGLICTQQHFENKIKRSTEILKALLSKNSGTRHPILLPVVFNGLRDSLLLQNVQVRTLMQAHFAVQKKVEYEKSWADQSLIQAIYPYGGVTLAELQKKPNRSPDWTYFFKGMCEIAGFLSDLHKQGYVHGDLSPNNLLYKETDDSSSYFSIVDWTMLCEAQEFLKHSKGRTRVPCWPPEHFALTTELLQVTERDRHWLIYADEMQKYISRSLEFSFSGRSNTIPEVHRWFEPFLQESKQTVFETSYADLKNLAAFNPALIGKYHDIRYFMDTIAKCVASMFPNRTEDQQKQYNSFIALYLVQNLEDRRIYLEDPDRLLGRLGMVLHGCCKVERNNVFSSENVWQPVKAEQTLLNLLNKS